MLKRKLANNSGLPMDLEQLKRWHWAAIGLLGGILLAFSRALFAGDYDGHSLDRNFDLMAAGSAQAPAAIGLFFGPRQWCYLSDLVVHPAIPANRKTDPGDTSPPGTPIYWVTGKLHEMKFSRSRDASGKVQFDEASVSRFFHRGPAPYKAGGASYPTVMAYLDEVRKKTNGRGGHYRFAWWEKATAIWLIYPAAGVLLVGGVWPTILQLLAGAGLGRRRDPGAPTFDLSKYKSSASAPIPQPKAGLTADEQKQLDAITAAMEADLSNAAAPAAPGSDAAPVEPTPRVLETRPPVPQTSAVPSRPKTFGEGDYYPTEIHRPSDEE